MDLLSKAIELAIKVHSEQKDKQGIPYLTHVFRVAMRGRSQEEKICGILHDVIEDSDLSFDDIRKEGFPENILEALQCLTKKEETEPYDEFINRIKKNPLAIRVKLNDLEDNMDLRRYTILKENDVVRLNKYLKAYHELIEYVEFRKKQE
jgi:(p)ppGpp synthase/HD superfamily hydrolase